MSKYTIEFIQFICNMEYTISVEDESRCFVGKVHRAYTDYFYIVEGTDKYYHSYGFYIRSVKRISGPQIDALMYLPLFRLVCG